MTPEDRENLLLVMAASIYPWVCREMEAESINNGQSGIFLKTEARRRAFNESKWMIEHYEQDKLDEENRKKLEEEKKKEKKA